MNLLHPTEEMDALLQTLGAQTVNFAIRSGIALTSRYAIQQGARLLKSVNDNAVRSELRALQTLLDNKIKILSPILDLIELRSGRGNVFLESAVPLAKSLHRDIVRLGKRLGNAAAAEEEEALQTRRKTRSSRRAEAHHAELLLIIRDIKSLLERIDRDIPLLQLAITASGEKMSTAMTPGISPSRMMQASALLSFADANFVLDPTRPMQVGPSFTLTLYMLFLGHSQVISGPAVQGSPLTPPGSTERPSNVPYGLGEGDRKPIWQEVMHKARVRLCRTLPDWEFDPTHGYRPAVRHARPASSRFGLIGGYAYHIEVIEDLDDGRLHDGDGAQSQSYDDLPMAGIRESVPIHQIAKIFYTDTGRILNIGDNEANNPVLLLKRDINAKSLFKLRQEWCEDSEPEEEPGSPSDSAGESQEPDEQDEVDQQLWKETERPPTDQNGLLPTYLPPHLDPEWLALEVYLDDANGRDGQGDGSDTEDDESDSDGTAGRALPDIPRTPTGTSPTDRKIMTQMRHLSLREDSPVRDVAKAHATGLEKQRQDVGSESYVMRSPFGTIASSLSLLEMLIRLTSLQEFQQTSHLAIPDHILTFFLEETSTTGLQGEARWRMRREAKRRMGFDPYTDTPQKRRDDE
ncbi:hypothetical protein VTJ49DRAFT_3371 [Mycothermus thermophilus]|uniref:Ran-specific GTPase-activating protein 30 n=1 Tax=Humicola insolens TaxID=85995 RepID=A0ABR3V7P6_HUMIN